MVSKLRGLEIEGFRNWGVSKFNQGIDESHWGQRAGRVSGPSAGPWHFAVFSGMLFSSHGLAFAASGVILFAFLCVGIFDACSRKLGVRVSVSRVSFA